jgi:hypothetical protein
MMSLYNEYVNPDKILEVGDLCVWGTIGESRLAQWTYLILDLLDNGKVVVVLRLPDNRIFTNVPWFMLTPLTPTSSSEVP